MRYRNFNSPILFTALLTVILLVGCQSGDEPASQASSSPQQNAETTTSDPKSESAKQTPACQLVMGFDPWEPYQFETVDGLARGVDVEIVSLLAKRSNCELSFVKDQWTNLLIKMRDGEVDVLAGATVVPEREEYAWFSVSYRNEQFNLFVAPDNEQQLSSIEQILASSTKLGLTDGFYYGQRISQAQAEQADQFVYAPIAEVNFTNLADGKVMGFLEDPFVASAIMRSKGWSDWVKSTNITVGVSPVSLMFSRQNITEDQLEQFNQTLSDLKEEGLDQVIFNRYLVVSNGED